MLDPRYSRLARFHGFATTLPRWQDTSCAVIGVGGLGCGLAMHLARMGVRKLTLIDRDVVGMENLGHQALYTEAHATIAKPKVHAAAEGLLAVNSSIEIAPIVAELTRHNIRDALADVHLLFDGLDNYYARLVLNDYALSTDTPYFYAGVVRGELSARAVLPGGTGCLRCLVDTPPAAGDVPVCSSEGVFPPLLGVANALQLDLANRYLAGDLGSDAGALYSLDMAGWRWRKLSVGARDNCVACAEKYEYLDGTFDALAEHACAGGRCEVTLSAPLDLDAVEALLVKAGCFTLKRNEFCLVVISGESSYTLFPAGRIVLSGNGDPEVLNRFVATYLGV